MSGKDESNCYILFRTVVGDPAQKPEVYKTLKELEAAYRKALENGHPLHELRVFRARELEVKVGITFE